MLGFDTQGIYVSTNQFGFSGGFAYAKVRIFNKAELYAGGAGPTHNIRWWDFWNLKNPDNSLAFSVQPACHFQGLGGNPNAFLVNSLFPRGSSLSLWTLSNPIGLWTGGAPSLSSVSVACRAYDLPPGAVQRDGAENPRASPRSRSTRRRRPSRGTLPRTLPKPRPRAAWRLDRSPTSKASPRPPSARRTARWPWDRGT